MRVLIISHMYPNKVSPLSGIFVQHQAEALARAGAEPTVLAPVPWVPELLGGYTKWGGYPDVPQVETQRGVKVYHPRVLEFPRSALFEFYPWTFALGMKAAFQRIVNQGIDLIHAHVAHPDGAAALQLARRYSLPVVVTIHGQDFAYTVHRSKLCASSVRSTLQQASKVILVSRKLQTGSGLENWGVPLDKFQVIYNGINLAAVREEKPRADSRIILLSVGFLRPDKGHAVVLQSLAEVIRQFPQVLYRIVGEGSEQQKLQGMVRELGLENHVEFLGSLPHPEAMQQISECDVFVLPSWREAFGVVYLEAMAHGKPIIGTEGEGIAEILQAEPVGIAVPPRDPHSLTQAILTLAGSPDLRRGMGKRGRELAWDKFSWEHNAQQTFALYQTVVADWRGKRSGTPTCT